MGSALEVGMEASHDFEADDSRLTDVGGTLPAAVLSTPAMISVMERTAARLVQPGLAPGQATVGFEVCVKHVAAASGGTRCTARARLEEVIDARKLRFAVEVVDDDGRTIGVGSHERRIVDAKGG